MKMHIKYITIIIFLSAIFIQETKAQPVDGSYSLYKIGIPNKGSYTYREVQFNCTVDTISQFFIGSGRDCVSLYLSGDTIYFNTYEDIDTGNTFFSFSGDYVVKMNPIAEGIYEGENELINLLLEIKENNEIEILVRNRIIHYFRETYSLGLISENTYINENKKYIFKKSETQKDNKGLVFLMGRGIDYGLGFKELLKRYGVNYGGYRITETSIIFEDITGWFRKIELRTVSEADLHTFNVIKNPINNFHVINTASHTNFPDDFTDYAIDKNNAYYQGEVLKNTAPDDFKVIDPLYAKTNKNIYFKNTIVSEADVETFETLNGGYAKDKNHYYRQGKIVKEDENIKKLLKDRESKE